MPQIIPWNVLAILELFEPCLNQFLLFWASPVLHVDKAFWLNHDISPLKAHLDEGSLFESKIIEDGLRHTNPPIGRIFMMGIFASTFWLLCITDAVVS